MSEKSFSLLSFKFNKLVLKNAILCHVKNKKVELYVQYPSTISVTKPYKSIKRYGKTFVPIIAFELTKLSLSPRKLNNHKIAFNYDDKTLYFKTQTIENSFIKSMLKLYECSDFKEFHVFVKEYGHLTHDKYVLNGGSLTGFLKKCAGYKCSENDKNVENCIIDQLKLIKPDLLSLSNNIITKGCSIPLPALPANIEYKYKHPFYDIIYTIKNNQIVSISADKDLISLQTETRKNVQNTEKRIIISELDIQMPKEIIFKPQFRYRFFSIKTGETKMEKNGEIHPEGHSTFVENDVKINILFELEKKMTCTDDKLENNYRWTLCKQLPQDLTPNSLQNISYYNVNDNLLGTFILPRDDIKFDETGNLKLGKDYVNYVSMR